MAVGSTLRFSYPSRAAFMARELAALGYGVIWMKKNPNVVVTSASVGEVDRLSKETAGVIMNRWQELDDIDVDIDR